MEALLYAVDLTGQLTTESAPLVDAHLTSSFATGWAVRDCAGAVVEAGKLVAEELEGYGASGAEPVIERQCKIRDEVSAVLASLG